MVTTSKPYPTFSAPNLTKLSTVAKMASSLLLGCQPKSVRALALVAFLYIPTIGTRPLAWALNNAKARINQSGIGVVEAFRAASGLLALSIF